jgi:hypothetical protein
VRSRAIQRIHAARPRHDASQGAAAVAPPRCGIEFVDSGEVHAAAARGTRGAGAPLPYLDTIQRAFGAHDVSGVRAYTGAAATEASFSMGASAFAWGDKVGFAGAPGLRTAAHEAAHVVQQRAGVHLKSAVGEAGDRYEQQADAVAERVVRGESAESLLGPVQARGAPAAPAVQRSIGFEFELRDTDWLIWDKAAAEDGAKTAPEKGTPVIHGQDFQLQAEYSGANRAVPELVTNYPGLQTAEQVAASVGDMARLGGELDAVKAGTACSAAAFRIGDPNYVMEKKGAKIGKTSLQVTAGVPLASVPALFKNLEGVVEPSERAAYSTPRERAEWVGGRGASNEYKGFMTLLQHYLSSLNVGNTVGFAKSLVKVMARTDLHKIFSLLPPADRKRIVDNMDQWIGWMLAGKSHWWQSGTPLAPGARLVTPTISDSGSRNPAMQIGTTREQWLRALPQRDLLTYKGRPAKSTDVVMFPHRSPQQIMKELMGLPQDAPKETKDALTKEYAEAAERQSTQQPLGAPQTPEQRYEGPESGFVPEMLEPIKDLYEGLGKLGGKTDLVHYQGTRDPTEAPILEIRNPPQPDGVANWLAVAKTVHQAVDDAIKYPNGKGMLTWPKNYKNVLSEEQAAEAEEERAKTEKLVKRLQALDEKLDEKSGLE